MSAAVEVRTQAPMWPASTPQARRLRERYGPWAVVTGGSDGIGRAVAEELAAAGLNLLLVARGAARLEAVAQALQLAHGVQVQTLALDLAAPEAAQSLLAQASAHDVGLLVAAAGFGGAGALIDADLAAELDMVDVNCRAVLALAAGFGQRMAARGRGGMVLFSSLLAFQGVPLSANYAATKAYVQSLAEGLHDELRPLGVDVLAAAPGPVHTGFAARATMRMGLALEPGPVARATLRALGRRMTVRPGWLSGVLGYSLAMLPRWWRMKILARVMAGMAPGRAAGATAAPPGAPATGR